MLSPLKTFSSIKKRAFSELGLFASIKITNIPHIAHYPCPYLAFLPLCCIFL